MKPEHERAREIGERVGEMDERSDFDIEQYIRDLPWDPETKKGNEFTLIAGNLRALFVVLTKKSDGRQLALQGLADALETMLRSASPNSKEHPTMFTAWNQAHAALEAAKPFLPASK